MIKEITYRDEALILLEESTSVFLNRFDRFDQPLINRIPFEGSWTAGQVAEHILKSITGIAGFIRGNTRPTERDPGERIESLKGVFLNYNTKFKSPDFIVPGTGPHEKEVLQAMLGKRVASLKELIRTQDLSLTCTDRAFPGQDEMTRLEWIHFTAYHFQRHERQLGNILQALQTEK